MNPAYSGGDIMYPGGDAELTEKELISLLKKGDRDAFNELVARYQSKVINISYNLLSDSEDALDASQEVFIKIYRNISTFRESSSLSTWIYRITVNICRDTLRKRQRTADTVSITGEDDETQDIPDTGSSPELMTEHTELQLAVRRAIAELSEEYKTVLTLCDIEGMSYDDISAILRIPTGTVKSRLNRARAALRKKISENREHFF